jgi:hypothetical protein
MADEIINKVAQSGIVTIDLEQYYPEGKRVLFDIKPLLFQELILKEKDFRDQVKTTDWSQYKDCYVAITCSNDAIVPTWAYMILTLALQPFAKKVVFGNLDTLEDILFEDIIEKMDISSYKDGRIVIKGCSDKPVPISAYVALTARLKPIVKSVMFGEPCSTVPLYKQPK